MEPLTLAEEAYLAYGAVTDFKNFRGEPMPQFKDLPETIQKAWEAAAMRVEMIKQPAELILNKQQVKAIQVLAGETVNAEEFLRRAAFSNRLLPASDVELVKASITVNFAKELTKILNCSDTSPEPLKQNVAESLLLDDQAQA